VINLANKHPRVNILNPGIGVGGHCIPVDPWFLKEIAPYNSSLISTARFINDRIPHLIAAKIRRAVSDIADPGILALGATYKKNCEDLRESPANEIVRLLRDDGYKISHFDPLVNGMRYRSISEVVKGKDLLVVLVCHDEIKQEIAERRAAIVQAMRRPEIVFFDE
jgi:UDP-N-acetyl-D-mannosaminuronic acid dehydrogenase